MVIFKWLELFITRNMDYEIEYFFDSWARVFFDFAKRLATIGVLIASFFVQPGDAALYLMTMNEISKI